MPIISKKIFFKTTLAENNARILDLNKKDIRVIIGNPPYSVGQESQNDNNQNEHYEQLDRRLAETYVARTNSSNKSKLYDSYIRAYRWASDRIGDKGIIGFVTNAGWLETSSADGMRKCMAEEFNSIYIYHLKGNQRTSGERSRREGGKVFGEGSRAPVAIVILVKNPDVKEKGKIYFHSVADYLTKQEKLEELVKVKSILKVDYANITPNEHGDWLNQRDNSFHKFIRMGRVQKGEKAVFEDYCNGLLTSRDIWLINSSSRQLIKNVEKTTNAFNLAVSQVVKGIPFETAAKNVESNVSWSSSLLARCNRKIPSNFDAEAIVKNQYRPFVMQNTYYSIPSGFIHRPAHWKLYFPSAKSKNLVILVNGKGAKVPGVFITNKIVDYNFMEAGAQCFPRYIYEEKEQPVDLFNDQATFYQRKDGISATALNHFSQAYPGHKITADDLFYYIYGILHSIEYRERYANNLIKELPRIPRVRTFEQFKAFSEAGKNLAQLHVNFESVPMYDGVDIIKKAEIPSYRVNQMKWGKIAGKKGNDAKDKTKLIYNEDITIENIPLEAQNYVVNKKSALDWVVERACVKTDKHSGIVNDFNAYGEEMGNSRYPFELFLRVITVSLETTKIIKNLPKFELHSLDQ